MSDAYYLSARYGRRTELQAYQAILEAHGHVVTSRWLHDASAYVDDDSVPPDRLLAARIALDDITDLQAANRILVFMEAPDAPYSRGGRHVELGFALFGLVAAPGRTQVTIIGPTENIFCTLASQQFATFDDYLAWQQEEDAR